MDYAGEKIGKNIYVELNDTDNVCFLVSSLDELFRMIKELLKQEENAVIENKRKKTKLMSMDRKDSISIINGGRKNMFSYKGEVLSSVSLVVR